MILFYSALAVVRRWKRNLLTLLAMLISTASVVAMVGISESSALATAQKLAAYDASHIQVRLQSYAWGWSKDYLTDQLAQLPEVKAGGTLTISEMPDLLLSKTVGETNIEPVSPAVLKAQLTQEMQAMTRLTLSVIAVATSFGLITTMQISVWERRQEIGISRALGAGRAKVARLPQRIHCTGLPGGQLPVFW